MKRDRIGSSFFWMGSLSGIKIVVALGIVQHEHGVLRLSERESNGTNAPIFDRNSKQISAYQRNGRQAVGLIGSFNKIERVKRASTPGSRAITCFKTGLNQRFCPRTSSKHGRQDEKAKTDTCRILTQGNTLTKCNLRPCQLPHSLDPRDRFATD